jgi:hypothetical protein
LWDMVDKARERREKEKCESEIHAYHGPLLMSSLSLYYRLPLAHLAHLPYRLPLCPAFQLAPRRVCSVNPRCCSFQARSQDASLACKEAVSFPHVYQICRAVSNQIDLRDPGPDSTAS